MKSKDTTATVAAMLADKKILKPMIREIPTFGPVLMVIWGRMAGAQPSSQVHIEAFTFETPIAARTAAHEIISGCASQGVEPYPTVAPPTPQGW